MLFEPLTYEDMKNLLEEYPDDSKVLAYFADLDIEKPGHLSVGEVLRYVRQHPPGTPLIPTPHGMYMLVGMLLSVPHPKFMLVPWRGQA